MMDRRSSRRALVGYLNGQWIRIFPCGCLLAYHACALNASLQIVLAASRAADQQDYDDIDNQFD